MWQCLLLSLCLVFGCLQRHVSTTVKCSLTLGLVFAAMYFPTVDVLLWSGCQVCHTTDINPCVFSLDCLCTSNCNYRTLQWKRSLSKMSFCNTPTYWTNDYRLLVLGPWFITYARHLNYVQMCKLCTILEMWHYFLTQFFCFVCQNEYLTVIKYWFCFAVFWTVEKCLYLLHLSSSPS